MGIWDGYQFGDTDQGGLIDRLLATLGVQGQYQPGSGFQQSPMDANASIPAPQQNAPIPVGNNYMMPRIGAGFPQNVAPQEPSILKAPITGPNPAMAPQPNLPEALQPYQSPGGLGSAFRGMASNVQGGPIGMILGGIGGAMGMGPGTAEDQARHTTAQTYRALVPILGEQKATLAILNPEIGKAMVAQALQGKQYSFVTLPDGTVLRQDAHAGTAEPAYAGSPKPEFGVVREDDGKKVYGWKDPSKRNAPNAGITEYKAGSDDEPGTVTGPDGKPIAVPPGNDRKTFVKEVTKANADAAAGKKTEVQAKAEMFANKMEASEAILQKLQDEGQSFLGRVSEGSAYIPGSETAGRYLQTPGYQKYKQAASNFITALLRQESGAAISQSEFQRYEKEFMPQPGDGKEVLAQKQEARRVAIEGMKKGAGPGYKSPTAAPAGAADPLGIR